MHTLPQTSTHHIKQSNAKFSASISVSVKVEFFCRKIIHKELFEKSGKSIKRVSRYSFYKHSRFLQMFTKLYFSGFAKQSIKYLPIIDEFVWDIHFYIIVSNNVNIKCMYTIKSSGIIYIFYNKGEEYIPCIVWVNRSFWYI